MSEQRNTTSGVFVSAEPVPAGVSDAGFPDLSGVPLQDKLPEIRPTLFIGDVQPLVGSYSTAPSACYICTKPSNGGRLGCCYHPICKTCFEGIDSDRLSYSLRNSPYCGRCKLMRRYFAVQEKADETK
jgi:hypothetical protein